MGCTPDCTAVGCIKADGGVVAALRGAHGDDGGALRPLQLQGDDGEEVCVMQACELLQPRVPTGGLGAAQARVRLALPTGCRRGCVFGAQCVVEECGVTKAAVHSELRSELRSELAHWP